MSNFKPYHYSFLLFLTLSIPHRIAAQRFQLGLVGGINISELAGDGISSNFGLNTGLKIKTAISIG